jgi:hypothetical protein
MRLGTWNVAWFHELFAPDGTLLSDDAPSARPGLSRAERIAAIARVFRALDADAIVVVEAPDISRRSDGDAALAAFAAHAGLRARAVLSGFPNDTQQELMLLYDPDTISARHDPQGPIAGKHGRSPGGAAAAPRFDSHFRIDLDIDAAEDVVTFSKPPLEAALETPLGPLRLIGVHVKSKAPHGARSPDEAMRLAIANRRKQLAQCIWLRRRIEEHLRDGARLVVAGDLNDGPGLDEYERLFGRSGVEIVTGTGADPDLRLFDPHADRALQSRIAARPVTARFWIAPERRWLSALLDYVMVSPALLPRAKGWRIWHPFDDPGCWADIGLRDALLGSSDHFPVTLDLAP